MKRLVFYNGEYIENPKMNEDYSINGNIATINRETPNTSGFYFENYGGKYADYSAYKTLYRKLDGSYQLSNDGSIYVPPVPPTPPTPHVFTHTNVRIDGVVYDALDFTGTSFYLTEGEYDFVDTSSYEAAGDIYEGMTLESMSDEVIDDVTYVHVVFRKLSTLEIQVAKNTADIEFIALETDVNLDE